MTRLETGLETEKTVRQTSDGTLQTALNAEISARTAGQAALQSSVTSLQTAVAALGDPTHGVMDINHTKAMAGSVTPGDTPGYPVTISQSGSYRVTSNLSGGLSGVNQGENACNGASCP